jgi:hypothetical protein
MVRAHSTKGKEMTSKTEFRDRAKSVTPEQHLEALYHLQVYKDWLLQKLFQQDQNVVVVMPLREVKPNYRDEWPI